jgi:hypothetical protein
MKRPCMSIRSKPSIIAGWGGPTGCKGTTEKQSSRSSRRKNWRRSSLRFGSIWGAPTLLRNAAPKRRRSSKSWRRRSRIGRRRLQHWRRHCARKEGQRRRTKYYWGPCRRSGIRRHNKGTRCYAARLVRLCSMAVGVIPNSSGGRWPRFSQKVSKPKEVAPAISQKLEETKPIDSFGRPSRSIAC